MVTIDEWPQKIIDRSSDHVREQHATRNPVTLYIVQRYILKSKLRCNLFCELSQRLRYLRHRSVRVHLHASSER